MEKQIKILTTTEQIINIDSKGNSTVTSNKVINTTILDTNNKILNPVQYQFTNSEAKYGLVRLTKSNPMRSLYSPNTSIDVSINGITDTGKWHSTQARIDGLTKLFSNFPDLEARMFNLSYDALSNTLVFDEK